MNPAEKKIQQKITVRAATDADIPAIMAVAKAAYSKWPAGSLANERNYVMQLNAFPAGQFAAISGDDVVGYASSLIVQLDEDSPWYNYAEITGYGSFNTHNPAGNTLYGGDIAVHPDWQGKGIAKKL